MKGLHKIEGVEYDICETQQIIFRTYAIKGYDMEIFTKEYLTSDFCSRYMDRSYSRFQLEDVGECSDFFLPEIGERLKKYENGKIFDPDIAEWMGFTYRQLQLETGVKSKELVNRITFNDMLRLYPGMHTIDELDAAERISEMYNLVNN